jgi:hypothetical protein
VQEERAHEHGVSALGKAWLLARFGTELDRGGGAQASGAMGRWHNFERAILDSTIVNVDAHGEQLLKHLDRRLYIVRAFLLRPRAEGRMIDSCAHRDAKILMKRDEPVAVGRLVEERALNRY